MSSVSPSFVDPILSGVLTQTSLPPGQYYALYMGSTYVTDAQEKNALKMAARLLLEQEQQILQSSCEVDLHVLCDGIKVVRSSKDSSVSNSVILQVPYNRVSACFILREDNKIISIGVTDSNSVSHAHVFMLTTSEFAERMVSCVLKNFSRSLEVDKSNLTREIINKQTKPEQVKPNEIQNQVPPVCLFDCYNL